MAQGTRGSGAKNRSNINERIKQIQEDNPSYSYDEARFLATSSWVNGEYDSIPTYIDDNGNVANMRMEKLLWKKGKKRDIYKTFFFDAEGRKYDISGNRVLTEEEQKTKERSAAVDKITANRLKKYGRKKQGGILRYPAELITEHADYLQIDIERYVEIGKTNYVSDTGGSSRYVIGTRKQNRAGMTSAVSLTRRPLINDGTILLPIPSNVQDSNNVSYGESRMNGLTAAAVSALQGVADDNSLDKLMKGGNLDIESIENAGQKIKKMMGGDETTASLTAADVLTKQLTASAVNIFDANVTANQLLARSNGEIINPNLEILFSDVTLRNFAFRYKLTPRNQKEAEQVKLIIRAFKRNMAPQAIGSDGASDFFLRSPNVFKLRYRSGNKDHPFLNKFKQCFLTDMQTRYTGEGTYSTYDDGTPVSIELNLSFKEIQPIYDIDYDEFPGTGAVGY